LTVLHVASMLLAAGAYAQANPCDQLKGVLAARLDASGVRGYTLETVPAGARVPPGVKVIGTCQGGASKILYRRSGATQPSSDDPDAGQPASKPQAIVVPNEQSAPPPAASAVAPPLGNAGQVQAARGDDRAVAPPQSMPPGKTAGANVPLAQRASEFMAEHWRWFGALAFVLIAALIWVWHVHRTAYDEAGLPRGPRL
jgi:Protein of unknown function (DUF1161)